MKFHRRSKQKLPITSTRIKRPRGSSIRNLEVTRSSREAWNSSGEEGNWRESWRTKREKSLLRKEDGETDERIVRGKESGRRQTEESTLCRVECPFSWFLSTSVPGRRKPSPSLLLSPVLVGRQRSCSETRSRPIPVRAFRNWRTSKRRTADSWRATGKRKKEEGG